MRKWYKWVLLLGCSVATVSVADEHETLIVYTELSPPYQYLNAHGEVIGSTTDKIRQLLDVAALEAEFVLYPWARALKQVETSPYALIYSIAWSPERADHYTWIAKTTEFHMALVARKDNEAALNAAKNGTWRSLSFAVQRDDISALWLARQGLTEGDQLLLCADIKCSWQHLVRGGVDYIIDDPALISPTTNHLGIDKQSVHAVHDIPELYVSGYLAANKYMNPALVKKLKDAANTLGMSVK